MFRLQSDEELSMFAKWKRLNKIIGPAALCKADFSFAIPLKNGKNQKTFTVFCSMADMSALARRLTPKRKYRLSSHSLPRTEDTME